MHFSVTQVVYTAFQVYSWLIFARVLLSWFPVNPYNPIIKFIYEITEPLLAPMRRIFPPSPAMPIDFSPILAIFVLQFIERLVLMLVGKIF